MHPLLMTKRRSSAVSNQFQSSIKAARSPRRTLLAEIRRTLVALCLLVSPLALPGQQTFRNLSGIVTDGHHEALKGAVVEVENGDTMAVLSYITARGGTYSFKRLDGNTDYRVWATFRGQRSRVKQLNKFDSDKPKIINFVIKER